MFRLELSNSTAHLILDRPDRRNALTPDMLADLADAAANLPPDARVAILRGEGKLFCAGFDLTLCADHPDGSVMRQLLTNLSRAIAALRSTNIPVVAAAHGAAIAGGCALLGGADIVVTDRDAKLGYPVLRLGVSPAVSAPFLRHNTADYRAMLLEPALTTGRHAHEIGLAHILMDNPSEVLPEALRVADQLAAKPRAGLQATKALLNQLSPVDPDKALNTSLSLTGGPEERRLLPIAWKRP
jgi:enoyl-CoA hydratase/carnithine racemase